MKQQKNEVKEKQLPKVTEDGTAIAIPADTRKDGRTLKALESQDKVVIMLEKRPDDFPTQLFQVNGVQYMIDRGVPTLVPKQIAEMWYERMRADGYLNEAAAKQQAKLVAAGLSTPGE